MFSVTYVYQITIQTIFIILNIPSAIIVLPILVLYRTVCKVILKTLYGDSFVGLLNGNESLWLLGKPNANIVNYVLQVEAGDNADTLLREIKHRFAILLRGGKAEKLECEIRVKFGYSFWKRREHFDLDHHIRQGKRAEEKSQGECIGELVSPVCDSAMDNCILWEILLLDGTVANKSQVIVLRTHHAICDGVSTMNLLLNTILRVEGSDRRGRDVSSKVTGAETWKTLLQAPLSVFKKVVKRRDANPLHGPRLSHDRHIVCYFDGGDILEKVLKIKKAFPGATFTDVIMAALSVACHKYFHSSCKMDLPDLPFTITASVAMRCGKSGILYNTNSLELENRSVGEFKTIPLLEGKLNAYETLENINRIQNNKKFLTEVKINEWTLKYIGGLTPLPFVRVVTPLRIPTITFSNLPGFPKCTLFNGRKLNNFTFILNSVSYTGLGLTLFTYDNKLAFGLGIDKSLMDKTEDASQFLKDVLNEIDRLYSTDIRIDNPQSYTL